MNHCDAECIFCWITESQLRSLSEDKRYAYVTYNDLKTISEYRNNTVMAVRAPPETKLQVRIDGINWNEHGS